MGHEPNEKLRSARQHLGLTMEQVAARVADHLELLTGTRPPIDADHIGKYERGVHTWPGKEYRSALRAVLGADRDEHLGFHSWRSGGSRTGDGTPSGPLHPVDDHRFLSAATGGPGAADLIAGMRVGTVEVEQYRSVQERLATRDALIGGGQLYDSATAQLQRLSRVINTCSFPTDVGRALRLVAAQLSVTTGWLAFDADRHAEAFYYYQEGLTSARLAGDQDVEVWALEKLSRLAFEADRPRDAVELAQQARGSAAAATRRCASFLHLREALGWAGLGDAAATGGALGRARTLFERGAADHDPAWLDFYDEAELEGLAARCQMVLGQAVDAKASHQRALVSLRPAYRRNRTLVLVGLGEACAGAGQPDEAVEAATAALALLGQVASRRAAQRLHALGSTLVRHYGGVAEVEELAQRLRASA